MIEIYFNFTITRILILCDSVLELMWTENVMHQVNCIRLSERDMFQKYSEAQIRFSIWNE